MTLRLNTSFTVICMALLVSACESNKQAINAAALNHIGNKVGDFASLTVTNPSTFDRVDQSVELSLNQLGVSEVSGPVQVWRNGEAMPTQLLDSDADGSLDSLVFQDDLKAGSTASYTVNARQSSNPVEVRTQAEISIKQGGKWNGKKYMGGSFKNVNTLTTPSQYTDHSEYIRYEGPGIESDEIGYRVYLDWRNGFDIFGKKTKDMVLQNVGQDGYQSYHEMAEWGADILKVGSSLGAGGYGYWNGEKAVLVSDTGPRSATVVENGPLQAALKISYPQWNTGDKVVDLTANLSMRAGSPTVDVRLDMSSNLDNVAIGLVKHDKAELLQGTLEVTGEAWSYIATYGQQSLFNDNLGMYLLFKKRDFVKQTQDKSSHIVVLKPRGTYVQYAFGARWAGHPEAGESLNGAKTKAQFEQFLLQEVERRTLAPRVVVRNSLSTKLVDQSPLEISSQLAKSEIARRGNSLIYDNFDDVRERRTQWTYTTGLLMEALDNVAQAEGDSSISEYVTQVMDSYLGEGSDQQAIKGFELHKYNIDNINSGKILQRLYARSGDAKYRPAIDLLAKQLETHPKTSEGAFWHKKRYPHQLWLDGVYMGMPFLAGVGVMQNDHHKVEEAANEFLIARSHLRDPDTGLYYHAWDEAKVQIWADKNTGRSEFFWSRGLGWFAMALVDILDVIPEQYTDTRAKIGELIPELADSLVASQSDSGVWYQIADMPGEIGNYAEASGSAMFTYFLAKAVHKGYLPAEYSSAANKAWSGLVENFISIDANGSYHLNNICEVAGLGYGRDGSYHYYMSERLVSDDPKGLAPAILAGVEVEKLNNSMSE